MIEGELSTFNSQLSSQQESAEWFMKIVVLDGFTMNPGDMEWRTLAGILHRLGIAL